MADPYQPYIPGQALPPGAIVIPGPGGQPIVVMPGQAAPVQQPYIPGQKLPPGSTAVPGMGGQPVVLTPPKEEKAAPAKDVVKEPEYPVNIKLDKPGGQTMTIDGKQYYIPGSTMYEMGFRTPEEYAQAQQRGLTQGPHSGELVDEGSVLARVSVYSHEKGAQSQEWVRINPEKYEELASMAAAGFTEEEWNELNREITKDYNAERITAEEGIKRLERAIQKRVDTGESRSYYHPVGDRMLTARQYKKLARLEGEAQFNYSRDLGVIPDDSVFIDMGNNDWSYESETRYEAREKARKEFEAEINKKDYPEELRKAYYDGGYEAYEEALKRYKRELKDWNEKYIVFGNRALLREDWDKVPYEYRGYAEKYGLETMLLKMALDNVQAEGRVKKQDNALSRLDGFKNEDGTYDFEKLASFVRTNKDAAQVIRDANFTNAEALINDIKTYNESPLSEGDYIKRYFMDKGWELDTETTKTGLLAAFASGKALKETKGYTAEQKAEAKLFNERINDARKAFVNEYGEVAQALGEVGRDFSTVFSPARVLQPDIELEDISGLEWATSVAMVGLLAVPGLSGLGAAGRLATLGVTAGAGSIFAYDTAKYWDPIYDEEGNQTWPGMSLTEKIISVAIDTAIFASAAAAMAGIKGKPQAGKLNAAAKKSVDAVTEKVQQPGKSIEMKAYDVSYDITQELIKGIEKLGAEGTPWEENVILALRTAIAKSKYQLGQAGIDIRDFTARAIKNLETALKKSAVKEGLPLDEKAVLALRTAIAKSKYQLGQAGIDIRDFTARAIKNLETALKKSAVKEGLPLDEKAVEAVKHALKNLKYKKGTAKAMVDAIFRGISDARNKSGKLSADALEKTLNDLIKAIKEKDIGAVRKAGQDLKDIGSRIPDESGKIITRKGEFVVDKAAEIVKIAEKRLKAKQVRDLTDRLGNNQDFIQSPTERVIRNVKFYDRAIEGIKREIANRESLLRNIEPSKKMPEAKGPNRSRAEIEAEKVKVSQEISRDNAKLYELENKGGEPRDILSLRNKLRQNYERLFELEMEGQPPGVDTARFREYIEGEIKGLKERLVDLARRKADIVKGGKAEELWGIKVAEGEKGQPLSRGREPLKPGEGGGRPKVKERVKPETKAKSAEELAKELMPEKEKAKPETGTESKEKTKTETKAPAREKTGIEEPLKLPRIKGGGKYIVLVWENGRVFAKEVESEELPEGYIETITKRGINPDIERRFQELRRTMTERQAARVIAEEYPGEEEYPQIFPAPTPRSEPTKPQPLPLPEPLPEPEPMPEPEPEPQPKPEPEPEPRPGGQPEEEEEKVTEEITKEDEVVKGRGRAGGNEKEWSKEDIKSAIAWRDGVVVHAIKQPYRRGVDEKSFNINRVPAGLEVMEQYKGKGSQARSVKVTGTLPGRLTVDVGNQDVIITPNKKTGRVHLRHERDYTQSQSMTTIKRSKGVKFSFPAGVISKQRSTGSRSRRRRSRVIH